MKEKLGNFLEIFGIVLGLAGIAGFIILVINNSLFLGIFSLVAGVCIFVFSLAVSQMLFSITKIEEDTESMSKRMEVLEVLNREAVTNDLFSKTPKKNVNKVQKKITSDAPKKPAAVTGAKGTCYKCGYSGAFTGNNFCPKCGNHSFYTD